VTDSVAEGAPAGPAEIVAGPGSEPAQARYGAVFAVVTAGIAVVNLDLFIVNVALPSIGRSFHGTDLASLSWVLNAYAIVFAALLVPAGRWADAFGRKRAFLLGLGIFVAASAACALAPSVGFLIAARVVQAGGGGYAQQGVAFRGGQHAEHRPQAEVSQARPAQRAFRGGVPVGPGHHVQPGVRPLVGQPDQAGRGLARPAVVAFGQQLMPAVQPGDEEEPFLPCGNAGSVGEPDVQVVEEVVQRLPGRPPVGDPHLVGQAPQRVEEAVGWR